MTCAIHRYRRSGPPPAGNADHESVRCDQFADMNDEIHFEASVAAPRPTSLVAGQNCILAVRVGTERRRPDRRPAPPAEVGAGVGGGFSAHTGAPYTWTHTWLGR